MVKTRQQNKTSPRSPPTERKTAKKIQKVIKPKIKSESLRATPKPISTAPDSKEIPSDSQEVQPCTTNSLFSYSSGTFSPSSPLAHSPLPKPLADFSCSDSSDAEMTPEPRKFTAKPRALTPGGKRIVNRYQLTVKPDIFTGAKGTNIRLWLTKLAIFLRNNQVPKSNRASISCSFLDGNALELFLATKADMKQAGTWTNSFTCFKQVLIMLYGGIDEEFETRTKLTKLCLQSDIVGYTKTFHLLVNKLIKDRPSTADKIAWYFAGINDEKLYSDIIMDPSTGRRWDDWFKLYNYVISKYSFLRNQLGKRKRSDTSQEREKKKSKGQDRSQKRRSSYPRDSSKRSNTRFNKRNNRQKGNHDMKTLDVSKLSPGQPLSDAQRKHVSDMNLCFKCFKSGHKSYECPTLKANKEIKDKTHLTSTVFNVQTVIPNQKVAFDRTDRQLDPKLFKAIAMDTQPFTLDACCNPDGSNKLCDTYCSEENSFLKFNCAGHHVWINPPYSKSRILQFLQHYMAVKNKSPHNTSACIAIPSWAIAKVERFLTPMTLVRVFPAKRAIWYVPCSDGTRKLFVPGFKWPTYVYYDPPVMIQDPTKVPTSKPDCDLRLDKLQFVLPCKVASSDAQVQIGGSYPGIIGLDTMASRNFIDYGLVKKLKVKIHKHPPDLTNRIILGDNSSKESTGTVHVLIEMGPYKDYVWFEVLTLPTSFQLILGQQWLTRHNCILKYPELTCDLVKDGKKLTLQCPPPKDTNSTPSDSEMTHLSDEDTEDTGTFLSALQVKRCLRKTQDIDQDRTFLVMVQAIPDTHVEAIPTISPDLQNVLDKHVVVGKDLPDLLPPQRDMQHAIDLVPDGKPPFKCIYRLTKIEKDILQDTIKDLLNKHFIEPSKSPFGAPILFVGKKDGTLRMCVDYRALNKLTVKNRYPLPRVDDLLESLAGAKYFSSLDLQSGYHQIRIKAGDEQKTAFRTPFGHFQWNVLPFGLCNAPATFQHAMNNLFGDLIGKFVLVYLDDILIFSKTREEHLQHLDQILSLLEDNHYYIKLKKCSFMQPEVRFLGHVISQDGIKVDPDKIKVVKEWTRPKDKTEIRSLLGFGNYFRKFIYKYSEMVLPLTNLTHKKTPTTWDDNCEQAFLNLKNAIINAPVLKHPDINEPFHLICDASNFASGAILVQNDHPIAFASKKFLKAERNYTTEERELLAVIQGLKLFRCFLEGTHFTICTDHNPLKYFDTKQDLSPRQARWAQYLSRFDYEWKWIKGITNPADFLSRNPTFTNIVFSSDPDLADLDADEAGPSSKKKGKSQRKAKYSHQRDLLELPVDTGLDSFDSDEEEHLPPPKPLTRIPVAPATTDTKSEAPLQNKAAQLLDFETIRIGYTKDPWFNKPNNTKKLIEKNGLWYYKEDHILVIPNYTTLRKTIMEEHHDSKYSGHLGIHKTVQLIKRSYWWPQMREHIKKFVRSCHSCQRNKTDTQGVAGLLKPLQIPYSPWTSISMDLITDLPQTKIGHTAILVVVDRLTKMAHFMPCSTTVTAPQVAQLFLDFIVKLHGIPKEIISDRDPRFTSHFWQELCIYLGTKQNLSTPYHPQTDGQTERMNRILEEMLRHFVAANQLDWDQHLSTCEFAINNAPQESTGFSPFYLNYGYNPLTPGCALSSSKVISVTELHQKLKDNLKLARKHIEAAQQRQKYYHNTKGKRHVVFVENEMVLLSSEHIGLKGDGTPKLHPKFIGPFKILKRVGELAYRLELPPTLKIHNVFHVSRLKKFYDDGRMQPPPKPVEADGKLQYQIDFIYGHRVVKTSKKSNRTDYLVRWKGHTVEHDEYIPEKYFDNCQEYVQAYWSSLSADT